MKIIFRKTNEIKPYERNPRKNSKSVDQVAQSIKEYGFKQPLVIDSDNVIVAGHVRWKAARKLGLEEVPTFVAMDLSPEKIKAYRIADNKLHELSTWDTDKLSLELSELQGEGLDLSLLGFDAEELEEFIGDALGESDSSSDPDNIPEPPDKPETKRGDLWLLGEHRLLCGDSSKPKDLDRLLDDEQIHLVHADPPYNVAVEPRSNNAILAGQQSGSLMKNQKLDLTVQRGGRRPHQHTIDPSKKIMEMKTSSQKLRARDRPLENDFVTDEEFDRLLRAWFGNAARVLVPGRSFYFWAGYANCGNYPPALQECGLDLKQTIIWVKEYPVLSRKDFMSNHEWLFFGHKPGGKKFFDSGFENPTDLWRIKKIPPQNMIHLTEKPSELAVRAIRCSSKPGENVLDLFGGSGSTLIGAEQTGRKAYLMELDEMYVDVIVRRFEEFTSKKANKVSA